MYFSKADEHSEEDYLVDHSIVLYLVGKDGKFVDFFTQSTTAADCIKRAAAFIEEQKLEEK